MRKAVLVELRRAHATFGSVPAEMIRNEAARSGVDQRTVQKWWRADQMEQVRQFADIEQLAPTADGESVAELDDLPPFLQRFASTYGSRRLVLTLSETEFIARRSTVFAAIEDLRSASGNRLAQYGKSTIYAAYKTNTHAAVRVGARKGAAAQRACEMGTPLVRTALVNDLWSIDEYDLKLSSLDPYGRACQPKMLAVRDVVSDVILATSVLYASANETDVLSVMGAAVVGFDDDGMTFGGPARLLRSDQGSAIISDLVVEMLEHVGMSVDATESHAPRANGDHEAIHRTIGNRLAGGPGSRRGWKDRAGQVLDHGTVPFSAVCDGVADWARAHNHRTIGKGRLKGQTPVLVYLEKVAAGDVHAYPVTDEEIGRLAPLVAEHTIDVSRGVFLDGAYFLGDGLAAAAEKGMRISVRQLLDPDTAYAFDRHGTFLGVIYRDSTIPDEVTAKIQADRRSRDQFVARNVGADNATEARAEAGRQLAAIDADTPKPALGNRRKPKQPIADDPAGMRDVAARFTGAGHPKLEGEDDAS